MGLNSNHYNEAHLIQQAWLENDLNNTTQPHIFTMCHEPAYSMGAHIENHLGYYPAQRDLFWNTLAAHNSKVFFCGHEHYYSYMPFGNVYQMINGPSGGGPRGGYPDTIGVYNYVVVTVNGSNLHGEGKNDSGQIIHTWDLVVDATPPGPVTNLATTAGDMQVSLSWHNPSDSDFVGTVVRCKTTGYPANGNDGILVCDKTNTPGSNDSFMHTGLSNGLTYYYRAFAYDTSRNYSTAASALGLPVGPYSIYEGFAYPNGNLSGNGGWSGATANEITVQNQVIDIKGGSTNIEVSRTVLPCPVLSGIMSASMRIKAGSGTVTLWSLYIDDAAGANLARWYGTGTTARGRIGGTADVTSVQNLTGTNDWDTLEARINTAANTSEFLFNGVSIGTLSHASQGAGDVVGRLRLERIYNSFSFLHVYLDDLTIHPFDTTPPSLVADFQAAGSDGQAALNWTNPTDGDFTGTRILFKTTGYPSDDTDGTVCYNGTGESYSHTGLANGFRYYYSAFARYDSGTGGSVSVPPALKVDAMAVVALDATIVGAKGLDDSQVRYLRDKTITAAFGGFFYIQEPSVSGVTDIHGGIKVIAPFVVAPGYKVTVAGAMGGKDAERYIDATGYLANWTVPGPGVPAPVSVSGKGVGGASLNAFTPGVEDGAGANNIGSYVRVWGKITQKQTSPVAYVYISDGSTGPDGMPLADGTQTGGVNNTGIRIDMDPGSYQVDDYLVVTGVVSLFDDGAGNLLRKILPVSVQKLAS